MGIDNYSEKINVINQIIHITYLIKLYYLIGDHE